MTLYAMKKICKIKVKSYLYLKKKKKGSYIYHLEPY